jgi:hypothetical protein
MEDEPIQTLEEAPPTTTKASVRKENQRLLITLGEPIVISKI